MPSIVNLAFGSTVNMPNSIAVSSAPNKIEETYIWLGPVCVSKDRNSEAPQKDMPYTPDYYRKVRPKVCLPSAFPLERDREQLTAN